MKGSLLRGLGTCAAACFLILLLMGCRGREPAPAIVPSQADAPPTVAPSLEHAPASVHGQGHEEPTLSSTADGAAALVLVRRLDGANLHQGGSGIVGDRFGIFAAADDMDNDGTPDIIVGAPRADPGGSVGTNEGSVYVYSGAALLGGSGAKEALLYQVDGEPTANVTGELGFRQSIATADFDGDRIPELVVGAWLADPVVDGTVHLDGGTVFVFSGAALLHGATRDAALLFRLDGDAGSRLGRPAAVVGDVNADGVADLVVGAHRASPRGLKHAGSAYLISGAVFTILHRFDGSAANDFLGRSVMAVGDVSGDGYPDFAIGASQGDGGQAGGIPTEPGYVNLYSGKDYSLLHRFTPPQDEPTGSFGQTTVYVMTPGSGIDFNGDGTPDIAVGSPEARAGLQGPPGKEGFPRAGSVYLFSGADFALLYRFNGERGSTQAQPGTPVHESPAKGESVGNIGDVFGDAIGVVPDIDGDEVPELMIGAPRGDGQDADGSYPPALTDSGYVKLFSGKRGTLLARLNGPAASTNMGHHVTGIGDVNKDGSPDILIGADLTDYGGTDAGSLYWYSIMVTRSAE